ncbi:MAG TPA: STN domain-containing protein, partial [Steroidobacteraceae bacterium]|nr:STN domain-containing protein [Steroidobacteraceae bacterium]
MPDAAAGRELRNTTRGWLAIVAGSLLLHALVARAQDGAVDFHIAAQEAGGALTEFSAQSGLQVLFDYAAVEGIRTRALEGRMSAAAALRKLLEGTGLTSRAVNARTVSILRAPRAPRPRSASAARPKPKRAAAPPATGVADVLDEIMVTAEKRDQALQRSALAVTALQS